MEFVKMHGLGNDFIVMACGEELPAGAAELAVRLCDRRFGVGGDGLVFILPSAHADCRMRIFNPDGSEAEQCGNAIRCVAKYMYDRGRVRRERLTIETLAAGVQMLQVAAVDGRAVRVRVDMGEPVLGGTALPLTVADRSAAPHPSEAGRRTFRFTAVSMGNPHCVIFVDDAASFDVRRWGPQLETHPMFPDRTNVEFVTVRSRSRVELRVWERGAGETPACGSGACAALVAGVMSGLTGRKAEVSCAGGELTVEWDETDNHVYLTGPAAEVFAGKLA